MSAVPQITLASMEQTTLFAPLVALGFYVREQDLLAPISSRMNFAQSTHTENPLEAILDVWVSILAGCRSISQVNTRIRPDRMLGRAWGRDCFCEQSTLARVLDVCNQTQVKQLRAGVEALYRWIGQAPQQNWGGQLTVDIDLTGMLAGKQAEGSSKGYFPDKRGPPAVNCAGLGRQITTRVSPQSCTQATHLVSMR